MLNKLENLMLKARWKREEKLNSNVDSLNQDYEYIFLCGVEAALEQMYGHLLDGNEIDMDKLHLGM